MKNKAIPIVLIALIGFCIFVPSVSAETSVGQDSQSLKNAFFTGISWSSKNPEDIERYSRTADDLDAEWIKTYDGTNWFTGAWHVFLAKMGWKTSKNGLDTTGNYDTVTGFSGGTRTTVTLLKQGKITANTLCLISPQVISAKELKSLIEKGRVKKIVVYQSDSDIFTSSHFKSQEGIEVRDFSGIKHGDWIDFVTDQIEDENISPELEIINPPKFLVTPEVSQEKVVGRKSKSEAERINNILVELGEKESDIWENYYPDKVDFDNIDDLKCLLRANEQFKHIYENAYEDEQGVTLSEDKQYLHNLLLKYLQSKIDSYEYAMKSESFEIGALSSEYYHSWGASSDVFWSKKSFIKDYEAYTCYDEMVERIKKEIPTTELKPIGTYINLEEWKVEIEKCDDRWFEAARIRNIIAMLPGGKGHGFSSSRSKSAYETAYYDEQKIIPPKGMEDIHDAFLKYLECEIKAYEYGIEAAKYNIRDPERDALTDKYHKLLVEVGTNPTDENRQELINLTHNITEYDKKHPNPYEAKRRELFGKVGIESQKSQRYLSKLGDELSRAWEQ